MSLKCSKTHFGEVSAWSEVVEGILTGGFWPDAILVPKAPKQIQIKLKLYLSLFWNILKTFNFSIKNFLAVPQRGGAPPKQISVKFQLDLSFLGDSEWGILTEGDLTRCNFGFKSIKTSLDQAETSRCVLEYSKNIIFFHQKIFGRYPRGAGYPQKNWRKN